MLFLSVETQSLPSPGPGGIIRLQTLDMDTELVRTYAGPELPDLRNRTVVVYDAVHALAALNAAGILVKDFEDVKLMMGLTQNFQADDRLFTPVDRHYFRYSMKPLREPKFGVNVRELRKLYNELRSCQRTCGYQREKAAIPIIADMQREGIAFDYEGWHRALEPKRTELKRLRDELPRLNLDNRIEIQRKERELSQYLRRYDDSIKRALRHGRLHCQWDSFSSLSGRMTARQPNLQAMPKISRPYFRAGTGNRLVFADYSQIELRVLAEITKDASLMRAFERDGDLHLQTAAGLFHKDMAAVSERERSVAKALNFGIVYGITAYGIQKNLMKRQISLTLEEAELLRRNFLDLYPGIRKFQQSIVQAKKVKSLGGRYFDTTGLTKAQKMNLPIQASAAEGLKEALALLYQRLPRNWNLVMVVHDEIVLEVPKADCQEAAHSLNEAMVAGMKKLLLNVPVLCAVNYGPRWG